MDTHVLEKNKRKKTHIEYPMLSGKLACGGLKNKNYYIWTMFDLVTCKRCRKYIKSIKNMESYRSIRVSDDVINNTEGTYSVYD